MPRDPLARLLRTQDGLITRHQALAVGVSESALRHRLRSGGPWQRVLPGVYAATTGRLTREQQLRAGLLHAGPAALVTGLSAAALYGLRYAPPPGHWVHLVVPHACQVGSVGFVRTRRARRMPEGRSAYGYPVVPPAYAAVDAARALRSLRDVRAVLCEPVQRNWCAAQELAEAIRANPRLSTDRARRAAEDVLAGCRSAPECDLRDIVLSSRSLPEPQWNRALAGVRPRLVPDAHWPEARLVVEVDSVEWHGSGDAPEATERRRARYAALAWRVLPVSPRRLRDDRRAVRLLIEEAYWGGVRR